MEKALNATSLSQFVYNSTYLARVATEPTALKKWGEFVNLKWKTIWSMPWCSVRETKLAYFQLRFLHRILPTNRLHTLMGKAESNKCSFCVNEEETLDHLFWSCIHISQFILDVELKVLNKQFVFSKEDTFFGFHKRTCHPYNFLILHLKYYIFSKKRQKDLPNISEFYYKFKFALQVEKHNHYFSRIVAKSKNISYDKLEEAFSISA